MLWTNPNPTASFAAQTVNIDLSAYSAVDIVADLGGSNYVCQRIYKGTTGIIIALQDNGTNFFGASRNATVTDNGVAFATCYRYNTNVNPIHTETPAYNIPYQIYGIK